ncbi:MAG: hypothetical protein WBC93_15925 [Sulfitobacter sp.]
MNAKERAGLAESLLGNPLWDELFNEVEAAAIEAMVYAETEELRAENAHRIRAIRTLRSDCEQSVHSIRERKAAPA